MIRPRALAALALVLSVTGSPAGAAPVPAKFNPNLTLALAPGQNVRASTRHGHAHHLLQAEKDLRAALAALNAGNLKQAHRDVAAAIRQVEDAIHHHHKHHIAPQGQPNGNGLSNSFRSARHHHHHSALQRVVHELRVAEKEIKAGATVQAAREIQKAEKTLQHVIASHNQLFPK
jgi:hypothetical protein